MLSMGVDRHGARAVQLRALHPESQAAAAESRGLV